MTEPTTARGRFSFACRRWAPPLLTVALGLLLALIGPLRLFLATGSARFVSGFDDQLYLQVAARSYWPAHAHAAVSAALAALYPRLLMAPPAALARWFGLGPFAIGLLWRLWAGAAMAFFLWLLFRELVPSGRNSAWTAALLAATVLAEPGPNWVKWLLHGGWRPAALLSLAGHPVLQPLWRVIDPAVTLPFLLLFLWLLLRAIANPRWRNRLLAAAALALLFYVFFYYWTAALLALALAAAVDHRHIRDYAWIAGLGTLLGLPAVVRVLWLHARAAPSAWARLHAGIAVPRFALHPAHFGIVAILLVGWLLARAAARASPLSPAARAGLTAVGAAAAAAFLLSNSQLVTGVEFQNDHWYRLLAHPLALLLLLAAVELALDAAAESKAWGPAARRAWRAVLVAIVVFGLWARWGVLRRPVPPPLANLVSLAPAPGLAPGAVVAGSLDYADWAALANGARPLSGFTRVSDPSLTDAQVAARWALNAWLVQDPAAASPAGITRFLRRQFGPIPSGPSSEDSPVMDAAARARLGTLAAAAYRDVARAPLADLRRFRVAALALPPGALPRHIPGLIWRPLQAGPGWNLWAPVAAGH
jgi:hypothetical protein